MLLSVVTLASLLAASLSSTPTVRDARTGAPVPYASVGVKGKPIGTVADDHGRISTSHLTAAAATDTVVVSCVGYRARKLLVAEVAGLAEIRLEPQAQSLREVQVRARGWRRHRIGHDGSFSFTYYNFHTHADDHNPAVKLGREVGTVLQVPAGSVLEDAHFYVGLSHFRAVRFRFNVRALDADGKPGPSLLTRDIQFVLPDSAHGWQHLDLRPYEVQNGPHTRVAVTLEWLHGTPDSRRDWYNLTIPAPLTPFHRMVYRDKPEDQWRTLRANLSLYVTALSPRE